MSEAWHKPSIKRFQREAKGKRTTKNHNGTQEKIMNRLMEDKVALVTGGGSGIGRAAALALANAGAKVVVSGRREKEGHETVALIKKAGGQGTFIKADVSEEADVERLVADTLSTYGRLDAAFN